MPISAEEGSGNLLKVEHTVIVDRRDAADIALVADLVAVQIKAISAHRKRQIPSEQFYSQRTR